MCTNYFKISRHYSRNSPPHLGLPFFMYEAEKKQLCQSCLWLQNSCLHGFRRLLYGIFLLLELRATLGCINCSFQFRWGRRQLQCRLHPVEKSNRRTCSCEKLPEKLFGILRSRAKSCSDEQEEVLTLSE